MLLNTVLVSIVVQKNRGISLPQNKILISEILDKRYLSTQKIPLDSKSIIALYHLTITFRQQL